MKRICSEICDRNKKSSESIVKEPTIVWVLFVLGQRTLYTPFTPLGRPSIPLLLRHTLVGTKVVVYLTYLESSQIS